MVGTTKEEFIKVLLNASRLYDVYSTYEERDIYVERTQHIVGDWGKAISAFEAAMCANDQIPTPGDLARFANTRHVEKPTERRPVRHTMDYNPREEIVQALAANGFKDIYCDLKKTKPAGKDEMVACCPFHSDKRPSFNYNTKSGMWICRSGCGGGSAFDYEMNATGECYSEVLHRLAFDLGIEINRKNDAKDKLKFGEEN
jgi:hypothetical protein